MNIFFFEIFEKFVSQCKLTFYKDIFIIPLTSHCRFCFQSLLCGRKFDEALLIVPSEDVGLGNSTKLRKNFKKEIVSNFNFCFHLKCGEYYPYNFKSSRLLISLFYLISSSRF